MIGAYLDDITDNNITLPINLAFIEIHPQDDKNADSLLSPISIKNHLQTCPNLKLSSIQSCNNIIGGIVHLSNDDSYIDFPIDTNDILCNEEYAPCKVVGYATNQANTKLNKVCNCLVSSGTFIRIISSSKLPSIEQYQQNLLLEKDDLCDENDEFTLSCYDDNVISNIVYRMELLLRREGIGIGTTNDAFIMQETRRKRRDKLRAIANKLVNNNVNPPHSPNTINNNQMDRGLIVWNTNHTGEKLNLIKAISRSILKCHHIYTLNPGILFSLYGNNNADTALQSILHSISLNAAVKHERICIVLNDIHGFIPAQNGDPTALNAMASYLHKLTCSIHTQHQFIYPSNILYNCNSSKGFVIPLNICIVGVLTCHEKEYPHKNVLGDDIYIPLQVSKSTRLRALKLSMRKWNVELGQEALHELNKVAALSVSANHAFFDDFGRILRFILKDQDIATGHDIQTCFAFLNKKTKSTSIQEVILHSNESKSPAEIMKENIGGNVTAKIALLDALAINKKQQLRLKQFGLSPPLGILLYGPPGKYVSFHQ